MNKLTPAFKTRLGLISFIVFVGLCVFNPLVLKIFPYDKAEVFLEGPMDNGLFHFLYGQFKDDQPVDIVFLGSSLIWTGIHPPAVKKYISGETGENIRALTLAANWRGEDLLYRLWTELREKKKPKMLVMTMPRPRDDQAQPHTRSYSWWVHGVFDRIENELSLVDYSAYFAESILGGPRHFLSLLRENPLNPKTKHPPFDGALWMGYGFNGAPFQKVDLKPEPLRPEDVLFGEKTEKYFDIHNVPLTTLQKTFLDDIVKGALADKIKVVVLVVPIYSYTSKKKIPMSLNWKEIYGPDVDIIGVRPELLFPGFDEEKTKLFYYNDHLNANGSRYLSEALAPTFLKLYREANDAQPD